MLEVEHGTQVLEIARLEKPDLIIKDILMLEIDGFTLARHVRADPHLMRVPIIFQTAHYLKEEVRNLAKDCGVRYILSKPIEPQDLLREVEACLNEC